MDFPFIIGQTYYRPVALPHKVEVPCPVCAGHRCITFILGSGEQVEIPCEGCGLGFEGPRGWVTEYTHEPQVEPFTVEKLVEFNTRWEKEEWRVESTTGQQAYWSELYPTEGEALAVAQKNAEEWAEGVMKSRQHKKEQAKKGGWTVRYHRERIADLQRELQWHLEKVRTKVA